MGDRVCASGCVRFCGDVRSVCSTVRSGVVGGGAGEGLRRSGRGRGLVAFWAVRSLWAFRGGLGATRLH